ncbi:MAG: hypothetical protein ACXITV_06225 [Luteibaculaceae bacterium]
MTHFNLIFKVLKTGGCVLLLVFFSLVNVAQEAVGSRPMKTLEPKIKSPEKERYFISSVGPAFVTFRDFATSPLFYEGPAIHHALALDYRTKNKSEFLLEFNGIVAQTFSRTPTSEFVTTRTSAVFGGLGIYTHYVWQLNSISTEKHIFKAGAAFTPNLNFRGNRALGNNGFGFESLVNLSASGIYTLNLSRTEAKIKTIPLISRWFNLNYKLLPVKRDLTVQTNVGVLNVNYRPGYNFFFDAALNGTETNLIEYFLEDYRWNVNGWRLQTRIDYTRYRENGNGIRWSYRWDAAHAPGTYEDFSMATHSVVFSILFNRRKR